MLSKEVKIEFLKWCDTNVIAWEYLHILKCLEINSIRGLISYLQLYFDSVGIRISIDGSNFEVNKSFDVWISSSWEVLEPKTRQEAWTQAVERADKIRNEQLKT